MLPYDQREEMNLFHMYLSRKTQVLKNIVNLPYFPTDITGHGINGQVMGLLKGRAAQIFEGSVYNYGSLKEFIKALKLQFGAIRLWNIAQYKGEPVKDYALRVQLMNKN